MAGVRWSLQAPVMQTQGDNNPYTFAAVQAASNHRVLVNFVGIYFKGVSTTQQPIEVRLVRLSTTTGLGVTTVHKLNPADDESLELTGYRTSAGTNSPTITGTFFAASIHPQSHWERPFPLGREIVIPGGGFMGVRLEANTATVFDLVIQGEE